MKAHTLFITNLFLFLSFSIDSIAQNKQLTCSDIKDGIFYYYPKNSADRYIDVREGELLNEKNTKTGDSSIWQVKWTDECIYSLKYVSGNAKTTDEMQAFLKKHKFIYEILKVTNEYYVFKGYVDKTTNIPILTDTIWLNEKTHIANNELFKQVRNTSELKKSNFSDTSKYAVLYIYRPQKLTNSLGNYIIYFDNNMMCVAQNNTGYIFKILKEGKFQVKSKLYKDESEITLDIRFGKTYYVKSMIHWGITSRLYNFKLEMAAINAIDGKSEFEEVDLQ